MQRIVKVPSEQFPPLAQVFGKNVANIIDKFGNNYIFEMNRYAKELSSGTFPNIDRISMICGEGSYYFLHLLCENGKSYGFTYNYEADFDNEYNENFYYTDDETVQDIGAHCYIIIFEYLNQHQNTVSRDNYVIHHIPQTGTFGFISSDGFNYDFYSFCLENMGRVYVIDYTLRTHFEF